MNLMNAMDQKIIAHIYVQKESFKDAYPWFMSLKHQGLSPVFITTDGELSIMRAMKLVWPGKSCVPSCQNSVELRPSKNGTRLLMRIRPGSVNTVNSSCLCRALPSLSKTYDAPWCLSTMHYQTCSTISRISVCIQLLMHWRVFIHDLSQIIRGTEA